ncbi:Serine_threonine-protein kinase PknD [Actinosynnema sp. ALI-1.44]
MSSGVLAGRYELGDLLGRGGMGEVRRAWDTVLRRPVAVKLVRGTGESEALRRFGHEVRVLAGLEHPGLVPVFDAGADGPVSFVVMRLIEGRTLRDELKSGPLGVERVRELGIALAEALDHVHARGVVHRDVKPGNVLLDRDGRPHLADFGLARRVDTPHLTRSNRVMGTAAYLAPEQVRGEEVSAATDVYALGLVLLECLTARREYTGGTAEAALARLHRPVRLPPDLPDDLTRLLALMTSLVPRRRPTALACAQALRHRETPTAVETRADQPRRWRPALIGAALLALAALVTALHAPLIAADDPSPPSSTTSTPAR